MVIVRSLIYIMFPIILLELFMGGGGRNIVFGSLSLRMYLFFFIMPFAFLAFLGRKKVDKFIIELPLLFTVLVLLAVGIGFFNQANPYLIFLDIKPLMYFYIIFFFYVVITKIRHIELVLKLLKFSAVAMALAYLAVFAAINLRLVDFLSLYRHMSQPEEFFFRGQIAFFYKGFLYLGIGFIVFFNEKKAWSKILALLIFISLLLTFTRGFIVALLLTYSAYYILTKVESSKTILVVGFSGILLASVLVYFSLQKIGPKELSSYFRVAQTEQVIREIDTYSIIWGHGFGKGVPVRPVHMEISYLEIFHKQGVIGLFFYAFLFILMLNLYNRAVRKDNGYLAKPFFLSSIFVFAQSVTNPYVNNPIGMSMVLLSLISLNVLAKDD